MDVLVQNVFHQLLVLFRNNQALSDNHPNLEAVLNCQAKQQFQAVAFGFGIDVASLQTMKTYLLSRQSLANCSQMKSLSRRMRCSLG